MNLGTSSAQTLYFAPFTDHDMPTVYVHRNTIVCANNYIKASGGDVNSTRNVIIHDGTYTDGWNVYQPGTTYLGTLTITEDLAGVSGDNIIDGSGNLIGAYLAAYQYIRGHNPG